MEKPYDALACWADPAELVEVEDAGKCWMCGITQSLYHQTAIEWRIKHALYIEQWENIKTYSVNAWQIVCWSNVQHELTGTLNNQWRISHRLACDRNMTLRSSTPQCQMEDVSSQTDVTAQCKLDNVSGLVCNGSTMSGGACTQTWISKNIHSTMSGGGCLFIDHRLE